MKNKVEEVKLHVEVLLIHMKSLISFRYLSPAEQGQLPPENDNLQNFSTIGGSSRCNGLFIEVHPDPDNALCDGSNMITPDMAYDTLYVCKKIFEIVRC